MTEGRNVNERMRKENEEIRAQIPKNTIGEALLQMGLMIFGSML